MAVQIMPKGQSMGANFGESLNKGINALIEGKMEHIKQRQREKELHEAYPDLPSNALPFLTKYKGKDFVKLLESFSPDTNNENDFSHPDQVSPEIKQAIAEHLQNPENQSKYEPEQMKALMNFANPQTEQGPPAFDINSIKSPADITPELQGMMKNYLSQPKMAGAHKPEEVAALQEWLSKPRPEPQEPQQQTQDQEQPEIPQALSPIEEKPKTLSALQKLHKNKEKTFAQELSEQRIHEKRIQDTNKLEKPYNDKLEKQAETSREISDVLDRMENNMSTGKVQHGLTGRYGHRQARNPETEEFVKDGNTLVRLLTEGQTGVPTGFRIKFNADQKPNIELKEETNKRLLKSIRQENNFIKNRIKQKDEIVADNDGNLPKNLPGILRKRLDMMEEPPMVPQGTPDGYTVDDIFGQVWVVKNGKAVLEDAQ